MKSDITAQLIGVCHGITADGWVSAEEVYFLAEWLNGHPEALKVWPGSEFVKPLNRFFEDGKVDTDELKEAIELLARIEREWAEKCSALRDHAIEEVPQTKKGRSRKPTAPPTIPELFDWRAIALPSLNWQGEVASSSGMGSYIVNLLEPSCDCPDWCTRRQNLPVSHPARACKHVVSALHEKMLENTIEVPLRMQCILSNAAEYGIGIFPGDRYGSFELKGARIIFSFGGHPWINVWVPEDDTYGRFGYNFLEMRWSYGEKPKNSATIVKVLSNVHAS